jgi:DNA excision repair protein ERCC-4
VGPDEQPLPPAAAPPPVFRPVNFDLDENLEKSVKSRMKKGHEPVLEELPKWALLAKILKEIEDTMARIQRSHASKLSALQREKG